MPLSLDQFKSLRAKGLTPQQIADFESGKTPAGQPATQQPQQSLGDKALSGFMTVGDVAGKALQAGAETFINPVGRALAQPAVSMYQNAKELFTGQQAPESVKTPWGDVKSKPTAGSLGMEAFDVATLLPAEKLFVGAAKAVNKVASTAARKVGEVMTGVPKESISTWYKLAKEAPEKVASTVEHIKANPTNPMQSLATNIGEKIKGLKTEGQDLWTSGKETFKKQFPKKTFDVSSNILDSKKALTDAGLNLEIVPLKNKAGKFSGDISVKSIGKAAVGKPGEAEFEALTSRDRGVLKDTILKLGRAKDISIDEVDNLKNFFNKQYDKLESSLGKKTLMTLKNSTEDKIQQVLPASLKQARQAYRNYYDVVENVGKNILDSKGNIKHSAEKFLNNVMKDNKGVLRDNIMKASKTLGIDILDEANNITTAKKLMESTPNTTKSRVGAIVRGIITSKAFQPITAMGAGAGVATGNIPLAVGATLLNTLSNPNTFRNLIEITAGVSKKLPIQEALQKLSPEEMSAIQQIIKGVVTKPFRDE